LERPKLDATRRSPRASDFTALENGTATPLAAAFYPTRSIEGTEEVLYRDNILIRDATRTPPTRGLSVASFALRWDDTMKLWYCDVMVTDGFSGWCGIALYRHQPHARDWSHLSEIPAWVYGAILHGEQVAWVQRDGKLHVTVGPVFDPETSF
jgi:hypothetical protein